MIRRMLLPALLCSAMGFAVNGQGTLPQRERDELAKIIRACSSGLPTEIVQASSPVAGRVGDDYWASYNAALKQQGLPSLGELIVTARMRLRAEGQEKALREPTLRERLRMITSIADQFDA